MSIRKILISALLAASAFSFLSCDGVIFAEIRDEVELEEATIEGDINSIVRFKSGSNEYLFLDNSGIYRKDVTNGSTGSTDSSGSWIEVSRPSDYVAKVAADTNYVYALSANMEEDEDEGENYPESVGVYYSSDLGVTWTAVTGLVNLSVNDEVLNALFCTNAPKAANRKAYFNHAGTVYQLDGGTATKLTTGSADVATTPLTTSISCAYFSGDVYFSSGWAMTTNETFDDDATYMYRTSSSNVYFTSDGSSWSGYDYDDSVLSLAVTKDYMLLGTDSGIARVKLTNGVMANETTSFDTNASSALSSYYKIWAVLAVNPAKNEISGVENGTDIYASTTFTGSTSSTSATFESIGLWSYYPTRDEWNRE